MKSLAVIVIYPNLPQETEKIIMETLGYQQHGEKIPNQEVINYRTKRTVDIYCLSQKQDDKLGCVMYATPNCLEWSKKFAVFVSKNCD